MAAPSFRVESLHVFPLKSGAGLSVRTARLEPEGLAGDRRMMVVDTDGKGLTARGVPKLMQIRSDLDGDDIVLSAPGVPPLVFSRTRLFPTAGTVTVWGDSVVALDAGEGAAEWLSALLERPCRLALKGGPRRLALGAGGTVSFADTAPLLLASSASLDDLNLYLENRVEMARFRPNLVVAGPEAYDEDRWAAIRIGEIEFEVAGACDRCVMVTLDPASGAARPDHEPLAILGRQRRGEDGKVYFGQFLIPRSTGRLFVGDPVQVLARKISIALQPGSAVPVTRLPSASRSATGERPASSRERLLTCVGLVDETHDFRTFRFETKPGEEFDHKPGQFITLLLDVDGRALRRNYTISSSPSRPHHISVSVKRAEGGHISNFLHDTLKVGDKVRSLGPNGRFHLAAAGPAQKLLMLSAGSGITPMIAMLRFVADANLPLDVAFHHSARTERDLAFLDELLLLQRQMADRLRLSWNLTGRGMSEEDMAVLAFHARAAGGDAVFLAGRLDASMLRTVCPDLADRAVLCCGPDGFRNVAKRIHQEWQPAPAGTFLEESFGADPSIAVRPEIGAYKVSFLTSGKIAEGSGTVTILELACQAGIAMPADCEAGICGTCRCRVVSGEWLVAANAADPERSVLSEQEKQAGYILACSTNPVGPVEIEL